jgi:hypothetical protein
MTMDFQPDRDFDAPPRQPACRATVDILSARCDALRRENDGLREATAACETLSAMVEAGWVHADPGSNKPFAPPDTVDIRAALASATAALAKVRGPSGRHDGVLRIDALPPAAQSTQAAEVRQAQSARLREAMSS